MRQGNFITGYDDRVSTFDKWIAEHLPFALAETSHIKNEQRRKEKRNRILLARLFTSSVMEVFGHADLQKVRDIYDRIRHPNRFPAPDTIPRTVRKLQANGIKTIEQVMELYYETETWTRRRDAYFEKHDKRCRQCGSRKYVQLHHNNYERVGFELDEDLIPLCREHHANFHGVAP